MKRTLYLLPLLFAFSVRAQERLLLNAGITGLPDDSVVYLTAFAGDDSDSTYVKDHHFRFDRPLKDGGDIYTIRVGKGTVHESAITLYLGAGEVSIKGVWPDLNKAVVTGSSFVGEWKEVQQMMHSAAASGGDKDSRQKMLREQGKKWVTGHPHSGVSAYVLETMIGPAIPRSELAEWIGKLSPEVQKSPIIREMRYRLDSDVSTGVGHAAPLFTAPDAQGRSVSLSDFRGKYVLVDFWASWCGPCRELNPIYQTMYEKCKNRNFMILGVSIDQNRKAWLDAIQKDNLPWMQLIDPNGSGGIKMKELYHIVGVPANFLVDPNGVIIGKNIGDIETLESKLPDVKM